MIDVVPVITIDGPSGTGKGTLCQRLAVALGWNMLDSGALYRVLALAAKQHAVDLGNESALEVLAAHLDVRFQTDDDLRYVAVMLEGDNVTDRIRGQDCGEGASQVAQFPKVRRALLGRQRDFAEKPGLVTDGRDMGTVVFPNAFLKLYLDAEPEVRAQRRYQQLKEKGISASLAQVSSQLAERDRRDSERKFAPLQASDDAIRIDTSRLNADEVFDKVMFLVRQRLQAA